MTVRVTFVEIYMEEIKDLLATLESDEAEADVGLGGVKPTAITIRETKDGQARLVGATVRLYHCVSLIQVAHVILCR